MNTETSIINFAEYRFLETAKRPDTVKLPPVETLPAHLRAALAAILRVSWCRKGYLFTTKRVRGAEYSDLIELWNLGYLWQQKVRKDGDGSSVKGFCVRPLTVALAARAGLCEWE